MLPNHYGILYYTKYRYPYLPQLRGMLQPRHTHPCARFGRYPYLPQWRGMLLTRTAGFHPPLVGTPTYQIVSTCHVWTCGFSILRRWTTMCENRITFFCERKKPRKLRRLHGRYAVSEPSLGRLGRTRYCGRYHKSSFAPYYSAIF